MRKLIALLSTVFVVTGLLAVPASAVGGTTTTSVVHGIPGLTVDVYVDGGLALDDFAPGTVAGPLTLPSGGHTFAVTASDAPDASAAILSADVNLVAGSDVSAVAHLDAGGTPTLSLFANDSSAIAGGEGRLTVRHLAAAPNVDVLADGSVAFPDVANGESAAADLPAATYGVTLNAAGSSTQAFPASGSVDVALPAGVNLVVYAIGDFAGGTFDLVTQTVGDTIGAPATVNVVHGVPGLTVDVYVGGLLLLEDFAPGTVAGPVLVPAGTYDIEVFPADAAYVPGGGAIFVDDTAVPAGAHVSIVAHLADDGDAGSDVSDTPTASIFVDDVSDVADGEARLVVRHVADAPTVDVLTGTTKLVDSLSNPDEASLDVPAGTYPVTVNAEDGPAVADLGDVALTAGTSTIVYAVGELPATGALAPSAAGTFSVVVQAIPGLAASGAFPDAGAGFFADDVRTLLQLGITKGTTATTYSPADPITRGQMAAFLQRALSLPPSNVDAFTDDDGDFFEDEINAVAAAGVTKGTTPTTYSPADAVTREQMAGFLARAFNAPASSVDAFTDDDGITLEAEIDAVAAAGITRGFTSTTYEPALSVTRAQMASFIARALGVG